ncbi:hypothetical protein E2C01_076030 [Portunus trituberculatus]|uniref:Uncharacterized protein n=1 Tax=Portunus trituberculatus TaxID=210409 RepID=A0A5B7IGS7_PORTR|nr:hypothetical protein [Portunus trituberculatus]
MSQSVESVVDKIRIETTEVDSTGGRNRQVDRQAATSALSKTGERANNTKETAQTGTQTATQTGSHSTTHYQHPRVN